MRERGSDSRFRGNDMEGSGKDGRRRTTAVAACLLLIALLLLPACERTVTIGGEVTDSYGRALPGVAVTIRGTSYQGVTSGVGEYHFRCAPGPALLVFSKTGYAPAELPLDLTGPGAVDAPTVGLWMLPPDKGVYLVRDKRFYPLTRTEPKEFRLEAGQPLRATRKEPEITTTTGAPFLVCYKLPPYDIRLHRLEPVEAALPLPGAVMEEVWAPTAAYPITADPLDEPERMLLTLRPQDVLSPGRYALHWGALDGYTTIDSRIFMIEVVAEEAQEAEEEAEEAEAPAE